MHESAFKSVNLFRLPSLRDDERISVDILVYINQSHIDDEGLPDSHVHVYVESQNEQKLERKKSFFFFLFRSIREIDRQQRREKGKLYFECNCPSFLKTMHIDVLSSRIII